MQLPEQTNLLVTYGRQLIRLSQQADRLDGLSCSSGLMRSMNSTQATLMRFYTDHPDLWLRRAFVVMDAGKERISLPRLTVACLLLGRMTVMDEPYCYLTLMTRISHQACRVYNIRAYISLVGVMVGQGFLQWISDPTDANPHVGLTKSMFESMMSVTIAPASTASLPQKYADRFRLRFSNN